MAIPPSLISPWLTAVRAASGSREWHRYLALHRNGACEMGLGADARYRATAEVDGIRLITVVGRIWCSLDQYGDTIQRFEVQGPWQVCLAFIDVKDAVLGHLGEGWAEPFELGDGRQCPEKNLLHSKELSEWPDREGVRGLAFALGGLIEDSWGFRQRRFVAHRGQHGGRFDVSRYSWF